MKKEGILKLILFKDFKEVEVITKTNTDSSLFYIMERADNWKKEDVKRNTVRLVFEKCDDF